MSALDTDIFGASQHCPTALFEGLKASHLSSMKVKTRLNNIEKSIRI